MKKKDKKILCIIIIVVCVIIILFLLLFKNSNLIAFNKILKEIQNSNNVDVYKNQSEEIVYEANPKSVTANIPVFMYHFILDDYGDNWDYENFVKPSTLEEQIKFVVDNGYESVFVNEIGSIQKYNKPVCFTFDDCFVYFYNNAFPLFKKYNVKATIFVIADYINGENYLTDAQIKEMSDSGLIDVECHTSKHLDLTTLNEEKLQYELKNSKEKIENITKKNIDTICYPYGKYNKKVLNICKDIYKYGVAMNGGITKYTNNANKFEFTRIYATRSMNIDTFSSYLKKSNVNVEW